MSKILVTSDSSFSYSHVSIPYSGTQNTAARALYGLDDDDVAPTFIKIRIVFRFVLCFCGLLFAAEFITADAEQDGDQQT